MGGNPHEHLGALQPAKVQQIRALVQPKQSECTAGDTLLHLFPPVKRFGLRDVEIAARSGKAIAHQRQLYLHLGPRAQLSNGGVRMFQALDAAAHRDTKSRRGTRPGWGPQRRPPDSRLAYT